MLRGTAVLVAKGAQELEDAVSRPSRDRGRLIGWNMRAMSLLLSNGLNAAQRSCGTRNWREHLAAQLTRVVQARHDGSS